MYDAYRMTAKGDRNTPTDQRNGGPYHFSFDFDIGVDEDIPAMEAFVLAELEKNHLENRKAHTVIALKREVEKLSSPEFISEQIATTVRETVLCLDWSMPGPIGSDACDCTTVVCGCASRGSIAVLPLS